MANQIIKRQNLARGLIKSSKDLIESLNTLKLLADEKTNSGLVYDNNTDFNIDELAHLDSNTISVLLNVVGALAAYMDGASGATPAFEKMIP